MNNERFNILIDEAIKNPELARPIFRFLMDYYVYKEFEFEKPENPYENDFILT